MTWDAPIWDPGGDGDQLVPGFVRRHVDLRRDVILQDLPFRCMLMSYLRDGVALHDLLLSDYTGPSIDRPYSVGRFPGAVFKTAPPACLQQFVDAESRRLSS